MDKDFIKRAIDVLKPFVDESYKLDYERQKPWNNSENGKACKRNGDKLRRERMKEAKKETSFEELELIKRFYANCPRDHVVDHIIPICKGGKHILSNLQYLTKRENCIKHCK